MCLWAYSQSEGAESQRQIRRVRAGKNCVQYGRSQKGESTMSWGTELWVCLNSLNCVCKQVFDLFSFCFDADNRPTYGKSSGRKVQLPFSFV